MFFILPSLCQSRLQPFISITRQPSISTFPVQSYLTRISTKVNDPEPPETVSNLRIQHSIMSTEGLFAPVPGVEPTKGGVYLWRYLPSAVAAILFLILFLGSFLFISWKIWRTRTWFCIAFATGCFCKLVLTTYLYLFVPPNTLPQFKCSAMVYERVLAIKPTIMPYAVQNMFILVAPALFAASIYMILGRIIRGLNADRHSLLKPAKLTRTFVLGDVLSFMIQGGGGGMSAIQNPTLVKWAEKLVIFGLVVQIVIFGLFCVVSVVFHRRMLRTPTAESIGTIIPWESTLYMLYGVSLLIMVRSIFRVIEYAQGYTGYALSHEWTLYVFDTLLMWLVTIIFACRYPSDINTSHSRFNDVLLQEVQSDK